MTKQLWLTAVLILVFSAPVLASHCPMDAKAIDAGLKNTQLDDTQKSEVMALRDAGMKQHDAGQHSEAEKTLAKAMRMLLEAGQM
jgi:hypothetical protein